MAKDVVDALPYPWEKYLPSMKTNNTIKSPTQVQRSFGKITLQIGTPANAPKTRGNPLGRQKGHLQGRKIQLPIVVKSKKQKELRVA